MQSIGRFVKTPDEIKRYTIEYANWLDEGETLVTVGFEPDDAALVIESHEIHEDGTLVSFFVSGGNDKDTYEVVVTAETSGGQTKQVAVLFRVEE